MSSPSYATVVDGQHEHGWRYGYRRPCSGGPSPVATAVAGLSAKTMEYAEGTHDLCRFMALLAASRARRCTFAARAVRQPLSSGTAAGRLGSFAKTESHQKRLTDKPDFDAKGFIERMAIPTSQGVNANQARPTARRDASAAAYQGLKQAFLEAPNAESTSSTDPNRRTCSISKRFAAFCLLAEKRRPRPADPHFGELRTLAINLAASRLASPLITDCKRQITAPRRRHAICLRRRRLSNGR